MATIIKAPFNFVPLNDKVFFPDWADEISHDIPFEDGESGEIEIKMEALTPIYVRNGMESGKQDIKNPEYTSFSKMEDHYFLPATSIKGMVRNVLEIMSFSKMPVDSRKRYAVRDWENPKLYPLKDIRVQSTIHCGWLIKEEWGNFKIMDCDKPYRINHKRIDEYLISAQTEPFFESTFCETSKVDLNKEQVIGKQKYDPKSARYKYELLGNKIELLKDIVFDEDTDYSNEHQPRRMKISSFGDKSGTIVFTGQPDKWKKDRKRGGKFYEFIFPKTNGNSYKISEKEVEQFKFIYQDSEDWKYWRSKFENGQGIPVFFRAIGKGITDFGFSLLYKLAYKNSIEDVVSNYQQGKGIDMAECIFGYTSKESSIKGRVQFGNAFAVEGAKELPEAITILGSPKASYYPLYIAQDGKNGKVSDYKTYNDAVISGWKRYPVKAFAVPKPTNMANVDTVFRPLDKGVCFKSIIRFHNLKKAELGALLSSLTFHGNEKNVFHNIGMAKPLGYGKLRISCNLSGILQGKERELMGEFEKTMNSAIGNGETSIWINSDQIKELLTMAYDKHGVQDDLLQYMKLEMQGTNEFITAKTQKEYLRKFSEISNSKFIAPSIFEEVKAKLFEEERLKKLEQEETDRIAQEEINRIKKETARLQLEAVEKARLEKLEQKIEGGLSFLSSTKDFDDGKRRVDDWIKKAKAVSLPENQQANLLDALKSYYNDPKNRDKKKWQQPFSNNPIWKKIAGWVGNDVALEWYKEMIIK